MKYSSKDDANNLLDSLKKHYAISTDWGGRNYLGLTIDWNFSKEYIDILMPDYVKKLLDRLQYHNPKRPQYAPNLWTVPAYGKRLQISLYLYDSNIIDKKATKRIQSIVGTMI